MFLLQVSVSQPPQALRGVLPLICALLLKFHELRGLSHYRGSVVGELSTPNPLTPPHFCKYMVFLSVVFKTGDFE